MVSLPNPLDNRVRSYYPSRRILNDRGIKKALESGYIEILPTIDPSDTTRIQPATLDVKIAEVDEINRLDNFQHERPNWIGLRVIHAGSWVEAALTETVLINHERLNKEPKGPQFMLHSAEARSSFCRLGGFMGNSGLGRSYLQRWGDKSFYTPINPGNFGPNHWEFAFGERIAQMFFFVDPFADLSFTSMHEGCCHALPSGDEVRSFEMGIEVQENLQIKLLHDKGFFEVAPKLVWFQGYVQVHASDEAYRIRKLDGVLKFSDRDALKDELRESIDIRNGYTIQPNESIVVKTLERFKLSPHIGIRFWDNFSSRRFCKRGYDHLQGMTWLRNTNLVELTDGWIDPGYEGVFGRQPKGYGGRVIRPGDAIGWGQVFFFPTGVEKPYGSKDLGSQHQEKKQL